MQEMWQNPSILEEMTDTPLARYFLFNSTFALSAVATAW